MRLRIGIFLSALCLLFGCVLSGAQQRMLFDNFGGITEAIPVRSVAQDSTGMMWLATGRGLFSYDGYELRFWRSDSSLTNQTITASAVMGDKLYLGFNKDFVTFNTESGRFVELKVSFDGEIRSIVPHGDGLFIGADKLYYFEPSSGRIMDMMSVDGEIEGLEGGIFALDSDGENLYIGDSGGLSKFDNKTGNISKIDCGVGFVTAVCHAGDGVYLGSARELYFIPSGSSVARHVGTFPVIKDIFIDGDDGVMVTTDNGLFLRRPGEKEFTRYSHSSSDSYSIADNVVWTVFRDRDGGLWFCTDNGISFLNTESVIEEIPLQSLTGSDRGNQISVIAKDHGDNLWLGGNQGLIRIDPIGNSRWYSIDSREYPLSFNKIRDIEVTGDGNVYMLYDGGLQRLDTLSGQFRSVSLHGHSIWTYGLTEAVDGSLWLATFEGLGHLSREGEILGWYYKKDGLPDNFLQSVALDGKGHVWTLGANHRAAKMDSAAVSYTADCLMAGGDGSIWLGDADVLRKIDDSGNVSEVRIGGYDGAILRGIAESRKYVWAISSDQLHIVDKDSLSAIHVALPRKYTAIYCDTLSHTTYLGGTDYLCLVKPLHKDDSPARNIHITRFFSNGEDVRVGSGRNLLAVGTRDIMVNFSDFDYSNRDLTSYLYRLRNYDNEWRLLPPGSNALSFFNVKPGKYLLEIKSVDETEATSLSFRIPRPWYLSHFMKIIYILSVIGLAFLTRFVIRERAKIALEMEKLRARLDEMLRARRVQTELATTPDSGDEVSQDDQFLRKVTQIIEDNMDDQDLSIARLSELTGTTAKQLYRKIKSMTGLTSVEYVRKVRLKKAEQLFRKGNFSVSEVMYMVGFSNPSYFSRSFKAEFGTTPSEFIASLRQQ